MNKSCCGADPCVPDGTAASVETKGSPLTWFSGMVQHCYDYATAEKKRGAKIVGIMCEYTPREIIFAAGALPVCLCGGSAEMVPAAEEHLPSNLCPLIKSTYGYSVNKTNPFLEMADLLVAETTCDGKKKMYELLAERHPMHVLELSQKPDDPDAFDHWVAECRKMKTMLEAKFAVTITDADLRKSIVLMNRERRLRRDLAGLMATDNPPLTGRELLDLKSLISGIPQDLEQYERALAELPGRTLNPPADRRVRVLLTGVPMPHGAERVMELIENNGGLVVAQENCTGVKPIVEDIDENSDDPIRAIALKYFHLPCSVMTANTARMELLEHLAREYRPQCVIEVVWQACLTYDVESYYVKKLAEERLHIPYLRIQTDYSPSDSARIAMRIEALFETVGVRQGQQSS